MKVFETQPEISDFGFPAPSSTKSRLWDEFRRGLEQFSSMPQLSDLATNAMRESSAKDLLCYADVYIFADRFEIEALKHLSLCKLRGYLIDVIKSDTIAEDVTDVIKFVYANTVEYRSVEKLRALVIHYAACLVQKLIMNLKFQALLVDNGEFGRDLMLKIVNELD